MSLAARVSALTEKHAKLEQELHLESIHPLPNENRIRQIKHEKLKIKDEIGRLNHNSVSHSEKVTA